MSKQDGKAIQHVGFIPYDTNVGIYRTYMDGSFEGIPISGASPWTFTGWVDETMSWKKTCYLGAVLNPAMVTRVKGPDALKFMKKYFVNGFDKFSVGSGRHGIICNEDGYIMADGVLLRTAEDEFETFFMNPTVGYYFSKGEYDARCEDMTGQRFLYQLGGPRALEIVEKACQEDLHDLKFMRFREASICGQKVRILRMGMASTLAYEIHGDAESSMEVYNGLYEAGKEFGIRRLGWQAYNICNHTENGYPQGFYHFSYPWHTDKGYSEMLGGLEGPMQKFRGSMGDRYPERHFATPYDNGWSSRVKFDHDFQGRAALEKIAMDPPRRMVTLEWNCEDVVDVFASMFKDKTYDIMEFPYYETASSDDALYMDEVQNANGEVIGGSAGRIYTYCYKRMISLCSIDKAYGDEGTEVYIIWGEGELKKKIRAKVTRMPYLDMTPNNKFDVETIPHYKG